jgi:hypothetical protein
MISSNEKSMSSVKRVYAILAAISLIEIPVILAQLLLTLSKMGTTIFFYFPLFLLDWLNMIHVSLFIYSLYMVKKVTNEQFQVEKSGWFLSFVLYGTLTVIYILTLLFYQVISSGSTDHTSPGQENLMFIKAAMFLTLFIVMLIRVIAYYLSTLKPMPSYVEQLEILFPGTIELSPRIRKVNVLYTAAFFVNIVTVGLTYWGISMDIDYFNRGGDLTLGPREYLLVSGLPFFLLTFVLLVPLGICLTVYQALVFRKVYAGIKKG